MVEGTGLENRQGVKLFEGSNPSLSAKKPSSSLRGFFCSIGRCLFRNLGRRWNVQV